MAAVAEDSDDKEDDVPFATGSIDADSERSTSSNDFEVQHPRDAHERPHSAYSSPVPGADIPSDFLVKRRLSSRSRHDRFEHLSSANTTGTQRTYEPSTNEDEWVSLNVGGTIFMTTRTSLELDPHSMLARMASKDWKSVKDRQGAYLVDRDPALFKHILNYLRSGSYVSPADIPELTMLEEARFFNIQGLIDVITARLHNPMVRQYCTVMYKESSRSSQYKYSVYPIRVEGPVDEEILTELNGGIPPPPGRTFPATSVYGEHTTGWSIKDVFLTTVFNTLASHGWAMVSSSGHGAGGEWGQDSGHLAVFTKEKEADRWDLRPSTHPEVSIEGSMDFFITDQE